MHDVEGADGDVSDRTNRIELRGRSGWMAMGHVDHDTLCWHILDRRIACHSRNLCSSDTAPTGSKIDQTDRQVARLNIREQVGTYSDDNAKDPQSALQTLDAFNI